MAGTEGRRTHPGVEGVVVAPTGEDQPGGALIGWLQQFKALEAVLPIDGTGALGETLGEFVPAVGSNGDGVDLDDGQRSALLVVGRSLRTTAR